MSIEIGQKYIGRRKAANDVLLRVVGVNNQYAELERCEHHEGLTHDTFPLSIDYLLKHYELISEVTDD